MKDEGRRQKKDAAIVNRIRFDPDPVMRPAPGGFWLGVISLLVGITLIAPPLSVLYDMNDESLRTATVLQEHGVFATLYEVPPLSVSRSTYFAARSAALAATINAVFLTVIGAVIIRSREIGVRLLGVNAVAHVAFMIAMAITARRFSAELDAVTSRRIYSLGTPYGSSVGMTGIWAALPGMAYPLVLLWLFVRHRKSGRRGRLVR